jgi:hypothetical protein
MHNTDAFIALVLLLLSASHSAQNLIFWLCWERTLSHEYFKSRVFFLQTLPSDPNHYACFISFIVLGTWDVMNNSVIVSAGPSLD